MYNREDWVGMGYVRQERRKGGREEGALRRKETRGGEMNGGGVGERKNSEERKYKKFPSPQYLQQPDLTGSYKNSTESLSVHPQLMDCPHQDLSHGK